MRDPTHMEQVERWARFVRNNPVSWKQKHTDFINALCEKANHAIEQLSKEKIKRLYNITNEKGYKQLFRKS